MGGHLSLHAVVKRLGEMQVSSTMLETGSRLNYAALATGVAAPEQGIVDKLCLFYAPRFLGADAVPLLADGGRIEAAVKRISWKTIGEDVCFEGYLRDPWKD